MPKPGKDSRTIPKQYFDVPENVSAIKHNFPEQIEDAHLAYIARRSAIGHRILTKLSDDCFGKWFDIVSESEEKKKALEDFNARLSVKDKFAVAFRFAEIWGYALLSMGFSETPLSPDPDENATLPPNAVKDIEYIYPIMKDRVKEWEEDLNPVSPTYGEIRNYTLYRPNGEITEEIIINADRLFHWTRPNIFDTPEGESMYESLYNALLGNENALYGIAEALWQNVAPMRTLTAPEWMYDYFTDTQQTTFLNDLAGKFKDFNAKQSWLLLPGMEMNVVDVDKGMAIKDHVDFIENQISAGTGISRYLLEGFPQGSITGSEINRDEYYLFIGNVQRNFIEKALREFYTIMEEYGILPEGEYELEWIPIKEIQESEIIEIQTMRYKSYVELGKSLALFRASSWIAVVEAGELVIADPTGNVLGEDRIISVPDPLPTDMPTTPEESNSEEGQEEQENQDDQTPPSAGEDRRVHQDPAYVERYEDLTVDWGGYMNHFRGKMIPILSDWENMWLSTIDTLFNKTIKPGSDSSIVHKIRYKMGHDDQIDLVNALAETNIDNPAYRQAVLEEFLTIYDGTQKLTKEQQEDNPVSGPFVTTFEPDDPQARKWLSAQADMNYMNTDQQINKNIRAGLNEILSTGVRIRTDADVQRLMRRLNATIADAFEKYEGNLRTMIRTETARIVIQSRAETYTKLGLADSDYEILVNFDACPECLPLIGNVYTLKEVRTMLPIHPNCRCDYVPIRPVQSELII
jgi:SPP1 gp7 family putative phage head morphogenesis protein